MKILFVSKQYPYPPSEGSTVRVYNVLKQLCKSNEITLISLFNDNPRQLPFDCKTILVKDSSQGKKMSLVVKNVFSIKPYHQMRFHIDGLERSVKEELEISEYDLMILDSIYLCEVAQKQKISGRFILEQNYEPQIWESRQKFDRNPLNKIFFWSQYKKTLRVINKSKNINGFLCVSGEDESQIKKLLVNHKTLVVPNGINIPKDLYTNRYNFNKLAFLGDLSWYPNICAVEYLVEKIYPLLKDKNVIIKIIGKNHNALAKRYKNNNIIFTGMVENVCMELLDSGLFIAPMQSGGGTKLKVLEAMALARPVITSVKGIEGIEGLQDGENVIIANGIEEYRDKIIYYLDKQDEAAKIGESAKKLMYERYDWDIIGNNLREYLDKFTIKANLV